MHIMEDFPLAEWCAFWYAFSLPVVAHKAEMKIKINNKGMEVTKPEIIGVLFAKLKPEKQDVFADIGCGSGSVSEFFAPYVAKVYAVDVDAKAVEASRKRLAGFENVEIIHMDGGKFLRNYDYDVVFFGGTKDIESMLKIASSKAKRIAVNAARVEIAARAAEIMKKLEIFTEILIVNVSKSYELAGLTAFKSLNPVFIVVGSVSDK